MPPGSDFSFFPSLKENSANLNCVAATRPFETRNDHGKTRALTDRRAITRLGRVAWEEFRTEMGMWFADHQRAPDAVFARCWP